MSTYFYGVNLVNKDLQKVTFADILTFLNEETVLEQKCFSEKAYFDTQLDLSVMGSLVSQWFLQGILRQS